MYHVGMPEHQHHCFFKGDGWRFDTQLPRKESVMIGQGRTFDNTGTEDLKT